MVTLNEYINRTLANLEHTQQLYTRKALDYVATALATPNTPIHLVVNTYVLCFGDDNFGIFEGDRCYLTGATVEIAAYIAGNLIPVHTLGYVV